MGASARWRLVLSYRGTGYHGFAKQPGLRTVAGELSEALAKSARTGAAPLIVCAGRTDAGVHATAQVVHVDLPDPLLSSRGTEISPEALRHSLNAQLAGEISVLAAERVSADFDARHSALWRRYRYLILESPVPQPLLAELAWQVEGPLDLRAMHQASGALLGSHDFRCFCRRAQGTGSAEPIIRVVTDAKVHELSAPGPVALIAGRLVAFEIQAVAFCHQMVRSITGQLVEVGRGRSHGAELVALLKSQSRRGAAQPAPAQGLCLIGVGYDDLVAGLP
jgi:tRNA pseudouridine38-40 synthase